MDTYRRLEDLIAYQKLCEMHIAVCELTHKWPVEERYELGSQIRRSSNSAPAQLAEKYDDRWRKRLKSSCRNPIGVGRLSFGKMAKNMSPFH